MTSSVYESSRAWSNCRILRAGEILVLPHPVCVCLYMAVLGWLSGAASSEFPKSSQHSLYSGLPEPVWHRICV